jgi:mannose-6-phosphate isomerase-like protein (cupin superfamily)
MARDHTLGHFVHVTIAGVLESRNIQEGVRMADVTSKRFDELESYKGEGRFCYAGKSLGVSSWGMNVLRLPPQWSDYPDHDHTKDGQEEVYLVLEGSAKLQLGSEAIALLPGLLVRVGPGQKRKIVPGSSGVTLLALGGTPGKAYAPRS